MQPIIKASEFKAKCLALVDEVARTGKSVVITKNGRHVAELGPHRASGNARCCIARAHCVTQFAKGLAQ